MNKQRLESMALPLSKLEPKLLRTFFITHLNRLYSAKKHIIKRLPPLADLAYFSDLRNSVQEVCDEIGKQIKRMDQIYLELGVNHSDANSHGWTGLIDDAFAAAENEGNSVELRDLSILYYMQSIESIEIAAYKALQMAADKLGNSTITQLVRESLDEANADSKLLLAIMAKYIAG